MGTGVSTYGVDAVSTVNVNTYGLQSIDGHFLSNGVYVLLTNQSVYQQNGIWEVSANTWVYLSNVEDGFVKVTYGNNYSGSIWVLTNPLLQIWSQCPPNGTYAPFAQNHGGGIYGSGYSGDFTMDGVASTPATGGPSMTGPTTGAEQNGVTGYYSTNSDVYFHNLTINALIGLFTEGDRLFVAETLTVNGTIDFGPITSLSGSGASSGGVIGGLTDPVGGSTVGGSGGTTTGSNGTKPAAYTFTGAAVATRQMGKIGGAGGAGASGAGGNSASPLSIPEEIGLPFGALDGFGRSSAGIAAWTGGSSGGGGGGDSTNAGGQGGNGGGIVVIRARFITGTGTIWSSGGNGAPGVAGNAGGGGGGGGGGLIIVTQSAVWNGTTYTIPGITLAAPAGLGGAGVGTGAAGSNGTAGQVIVIPG